ncbi:MAG: hypothetical protein KAU46_12040 [Candidatus Aminicenantes bacterium]|nr:hypothetical protein [Candidatus Aminicenantes bacterium]
MLLEPEQEQLLIELVEAEKSVPREKRQPFYVVAEARKTSLTLIHPAIPNDAPGVFEGDLDTLQLKGLISAKCGRYGLESFFITPEGFQVYRQIKQRIADPIERTQTAVRDYLSAHAFSGRYPSAYKKWSEAESLLWANESQANFTTIGHLVREAMQEFAEALVKRSNVPYVPTDKAKTVARIRAVLEERKDQLGNTVGPFLNALLAYWGTVSDLAQRQVHGGQKQSSQLNWPDAKRVVFQSAIVMFEIDNSLSK